MPDRLRLGLIFGGRSVEHEVSVVSAQNVLAAADSSRFEVVPIGVTKQGVWLTPEATRAELARPDAPFRKSLDSSSAANFAESVSSLVGLDVVFPLIHGRQGEDGSLQGLLEIAGLPYVGCGVASSAIGMDKALMKAVLRSEGLPVAEYMVATLTADIDLTALARDAESRLGFPTFVKPANGGSSLGVGKATDREGMVAALTEAGRYDRKLVIEKAVVGIEVECAVLGNDHPEASPVGQIRHHRDFYDFEAKYLDDSTEVIAPADLPTETARRIQDMALRAYRALDCAGMARVDFFLCPDDSLVITEINTLPGFTPASMFPRLWQTAGVSYSELITRLVDMALSRHKERPIA